MRPPFFRIRHASAMALSGCTAWCRAWLRNARSTAPVRIGTSSRSPSRYSRLAIPCVRARAAPNYTQPPSVETIGIVAGLENADLWQARERRGKGLSRCAGGGCHSSVVLVQPITASIQRARVPPWEFSDCPGSHIRRARGATLGRESPEVQVPGGSTLLGSCRLVQGREQSLGPQRQANRCSVVTVSHQEPPLGGAHGQLWECGSAEPVRTGRRPVSAGKESDICTRGAPRRRGGGTKERIDVSKVGKVCSPAKTRPYGKDPAYNRKTGSRREGSRLAAEAV